jgi:hypothetical protein
MNFIFHMTLKRYETYTLQGKIKEHESYPLQDNKRACTLHFSIQYKGTNLKLYHAIKGHESYTLQRNTRARTLHFTIQ